jgi:hypothetical protein
MWHVEEVGLRGGGRWEMDKWMIVRERQGRVREGWYRECVTL